MSDPWFWAAALAAVAVIAYTRLAGGPRMSPSELKEKLAAGATVLDVRTPEEVAGGSYPGALTIPVQALAQRLGEVPKGKPVVVYCAAGARAATAVQLLKQAGHAEVYNAGGFCDMPR